MKTHFFDFMQKDFIRSSLGSSQYKEIMYIYFEECMIIQKRNEAPKFRVLCPFPTNKFHYCGLALCSFIRFVLP